MRDSAELILLPTVLAHDAAAYAALPANLAAEVARCAVFFCENERTARRFFKKIWKEMVIDDYEWHTIESAGEAQLQALDKALQQGKKVGIVSEAGLPCVADPGAVLVAFAQQKNVRITPLSGPSSLMMALMGSGLNGQQFQFGGYLPIEATARRRAIAQAELYSAKEKCTMLYIETPYRNDSLLKDLLQTLRPETRLCAAINLSSADQKVVTQPVAQWRKMVPVLHKQQVVFLFLAGQ